MADGMAGRSCELALEPELEPELELELDKVCRTCLREEPDMRSVFARTLHLDARITTMLHSCTQLEFDEDDGLPIHICCKCFDSVINAFTFKLQAERTDKKLRNYIFGKNESNNKMIPSIKSEVFDDEEMDPSSDVKTELDDDYEYDDNLETESVGIEDDESDDSEDIKPLKELKDIANRKNEDPDFSVTKQIVKHRQRNRSDMRRILMCKLCDKTFKYINCLKKHLQNHIAFEPFVTVDLKSKASLLGDYEAVSFDKRIDIVKKHGTKPDSIADDYIIKLIIEDIKAGNYDQYIGEVPSDSNILPRVVQNPLNNVTLYKNEATDKKKKMFIIKSKIKGGIKKVRKHKLHKCSICERMFSRSNHLIRHMSTHNYDYPDKCEICNKVFPNKDFLMKHNKEQCENTSKPYCCATCDMKFVDERSFNEHTLQRHKDESVTANFIQFEDIIAEKLEQYISELKVDNQIIKPEFENTIKMYACSGCEIRFTDETSFDVHAMERHIGENVTFTVIEIDTIKTENMSDDENQDFHSDDNDDDDDLPISSMNKSDNKYYTLKSTMKRGIKKLRKHKLHECSLCERMFTRSNHLMRHMSTHNYNYPDKCEICLKVFPNKDMLEKHSLMRCENAPKTYQCGTCDTVFDTEEQFNEHVIDHHKGETVTMNFVNPLCRPKQKPFPCEECSKAFYRKDHLEKHLKLHKIRGRKFECHICLRKFKEKDNLISHSIVHELKKGLDSRYHCMYCERSFTNTSNLIVHMRRHTGEKPFKCDFCDKGFPRSSDLRCHRRMHTGEKPSLCTICGKGFSRSNKLVRHMRVHTGQRPYKCTYCDRAFTQSNDLTLHIRRHTGDRPYVCSICGERFINGTALLCHRRSQGHEQPIIVPPPFSIPMINCEGGTNATLAAQVEVTIKAED